MDRRVAVREAYDRIADHFAATREHPWPEVERFLEAEGPRAARTAPGCVGLDVGCGNCRHAEGLARHCDRVVGVDASRGLLAAGRERARERGFAVELLQGDAARLPVRTGAVDLGVYVATLHHLPSREGRVASLDELGRVLAPGSRALVSAWSTAHDRFDADADADEGFDATIEWTLPGGETVDRFYHIYAPREFAADLAASRLSTVRNAVSSGNCYAVVEPGSPDGKE